MKENFDSQLVKKIGDEVSAKENRFQKRVEVIMAENEGMSREEAEEQVRIEGSEGLKLAKEQKARELDV